MRVIEKRIELVEYPEHLLSAFFFGQTQALPKCMCDLNQNLLYLVEVCSFDILEYITASHWEI